MICVEDLQLPCPMCRPDAARAAADELPLPAPHRREPACALCAADLEWLVEYTSAAPTGNGWEILVCTECEAIVERRFVGH